MRQALLSVVAASFLAAMPAMAQSAPGPLAAAMAAEGHGAAPADGASLTHSAVKATTFKVATTVTNVALLSYAAGGIIGGTALSAFMLGSSWVLYTANDYFWDKYSPPVAKQADGQEFDASSDVWRNTMKYLTYKPVIASIKLASLYVYTGSAGIAAVFGTASILTNTVVFYVNNTAWDMYDWYAAAPAVVKPAR